MKQYEFNGQTYELPDEATMDQVSKFILDKQQKQTFSGDVQKNPSILPRIGGDILGGVLGGLQGLGNLESKAIQEQVARFSPEMASKIHQNKIDFGKELGVGNPNVLDKLLQDISSYAPYGPLGGASAAGRIGASALYSAGQNPEDIGRGAASGGILGAAAEVLPGALKGIRAGAEMVNPIEFSKNLIRSIREKGIAAKNAASAEYGKALNQYGSEQVVVPDFNKNKVKKYFGPKLENIYDDLKKNPTLDNLHSFISQLGTASRNYAKGKDTYSHHASEFLDQARELSKNKLLGKLESISPEAAQSYKKGAYIHRNEYIPFIETLNLRKINQGTIEERSPGSLQSILKNALEKETSKKNIPAGHYLREAKSAIDKKLERSKALEQFSSLGIGAKLGSMLGGHAPSGALIGSILHPAKGLAELAQNKFINNLINNKGTRGGYEGLRRALLASLSGGNLQNGT